MKAVILRTGSGSIPVRSWTPSPGSPRVSVSFSVYDSVTGCEKNSGCSSPCISLHMELNRRIIRRVSSEPNVIRSAIEHSAAAKTLSKVGSVSFPARIPEENESSAGSLTLLEKRKSYTGDWPQSTIPLEELGLSGGGTGNNWNSGSGGGSDEFSADRSKIDTHYQQMLKSDPTNSLLLRNYGKYLHEVEGDLVKAQEYYERAILASPGDGEVLSLYGKLIWETQRDENRAKSYFDQAVQASPEDCTVLGSYAHFMWEAEDDDDEEDDVVSVSSATAVVEAY